MEIFDDTVRSALEAYGLEGTPSWRRLGAGLINETFLVEATGTRLVLQRLSPIFDPGIHHNIEAVTRRLRERGMETPELIRTVHGDLWTELEDGSIWRAQTYLEGETRERVESPADAREAARLLARFHGALEGLEHHFVSLRFDVHDLASHLATLEAALDEHSAHRLRPQVAPLAEQILEAARPLEPLGALPLRPVHGDPKFSNVLFTTSGASGANCARALVDLDTVAPQPLMVELGDAWRSWCNPAGEDGAEATLDLERFEATVLGYREGRSFEIGPEERESLLDGVERISLELACRFAADALRECYFGWDPKRFPSAGEHHLERAEGQWQLHRSAVASRVPRARVLSLL